MPTGLEHSSVVVACTPLSPSPPPLFSRRSSGSGLITYLFALSSSKLRRSCSVLKTEVLLPPVSLLSAFHRVSPSDSNHFTSDTQPLQTPSLRALLSIFVCIYIYFFLRMFVFLSLCYIFNSIHYLPTQNCFSPMLRWMYASAGVTLRLGLTE